MLIAAVGVWGVFKMAFYVASETGRTINADKPPAGTSADAGGSSSEAPASGGDPKAASPLERRLPLLPGVARTIDGAAAGGAVCFLCGTAQTGCTSSELPAHPSGYTGVGPPASGMARAKMASFPSPSQDTQGQDPVAILAKGYKGGQDSLAILAKGNTGAGPPAERLEDTRGRDPLGTRSDSGKPYNGQPSDTRGRDP